MSWMISPKYKDPDYSSVSLLLHGDGANNSTTFTDNSPSPKTGTAVGDAKVFNDGVLVDPFGRTNAGVLSFDKTADRITYDSNNDFAFGTGDFTIEFWMYSRDVSGSGDRGILQISSTTGGLATSYSGGIIISQGKTGAAAIFSGGLAVAIDGNNYFGSAANTQVIKVNTWHHIAITRTGSTCKAFVDGVEIGTRSSSANLTGTYLVVGGYYSTNYLYDGYIDDLRITKGVARYTTNFTPPTAPFPDI